MATSGEAASGRPVSQAGTGTKRAQDYAAVRDWEGYFSLMLGKPARETLLAALGAFEREDAKRGGEARARCAVDLGCGEGRDTLELLARGWRVTAIDGEPRAGELLMPRVRPEWGERLRFVTSAFAAIELPEVDLLNASYALPFCEPKDWDEMWAKIVRSVRPGGRFAGQLFGDRDGWAVLPDRTHHRRGEIDGLFKDFVIEELREEDRPDTTHDGRPKPWHVFHIVARKRA